MALTLNNLVGFETGGLEEASAITGSPALEETTVRTGDYSLRFTSAATYKYSISPFESVADAGDDQIVGFAVYFSSLPGANAYFFYAGETGDPSLTYAWAFVILPGGGLQVRDVNGSIADIPSVFTAGQWHFVEVRWQHLDSGEIDVWVDGSSKASLSDKDLSRGGTFDTYQVRGVNIVTVFVDDFYFMSGASDTGDFLGDCEVFRYQADTNSATPDTGDDLDYGDPNALWQEVGTTPADADEIGYAAYPTTGAVYTDDVASGKHYRHGPHGDANIDGTIKGGKWLHQLRGGGAGDYYKRYGNDGDGLTDEVATLTTAYASYMTVSELATVVPLSTEHFAMGFKNLTQKKDLFCKGMWAFILHVPSAGQTYQRSCSRTGAITASIVRTGSTYKREPARSGAITATLARTGSTYKREPTNTVSPSSSVVRKEIAKRAPSRSGAVSASVVRKETARRIPNRSGSVTAAVDRVATYRRLQTRTGAVTAVVVGIKKCIRAASRSGSIVAAVVHGGTFLREVARSGSVSASVVRGGTFKREMSRSGAVSASVDRVVKIIKTVSRTGTITAVLSRAGSTYKRTGSRTGAITATAVRVLTAVRAASRSGAVSASVSRAGSTYKRAVSRTGAVSASVDYVVLGVIKRFLSRTGAVTATVSRVGSTYKRELVRIGGVSAGVGKDLISEANYFLRRWYR